MSAEPSYRFDDFLLDVPNRQLWHGEQRLDLNARYFDALALLVRTHGQLVDKDRFFADVWGDVVVSDAALTQCIKDIRKHLGDDASNPRYIQTVPRYGYRFIGSVEVVASTAPSTAEVEAPAAGASVAAAPVAGASGAVARASVARREALFDGVAGTLGGGAAGVVGGFVYGLGLGASPVQAGVGTASILVVLVSLNVFVGLVGGFGISFGMAAARLATLHPAARIAGAGLGGMLVGGLTRLLGVDAFNLFFGSAPAGITGGLEGAVLGGWIALGLFLGGGAGAVREWRPVLGAALGGGVAGVLIPLAGGRLMGGSLELLARSFSGTRLDLDAMGRFFGEVHFGYTSQVMLGGLEGLLFGAGIAGALVLARRLRLAHRQVQRPA